MWYRIRKSYLYCGAREIAFWCGYKGSYELFKGGREDSGKGSGIKNESGNSYLEGENAQNKCNLKKKSI